MRSRRARRRASAATIERRNLGGSAAERGFAPRNILAGGRARGVRKLSMRLRRGDCPTIYSFTAFRLPTANAPPTNTDSNSTTGANRKSNSASPGGNILPSHVSAHPRPSVTNSQFTPSPSTAAATSPVNQPTRIDLPPIGYDAGSVTTATEPLSVATLMLAKEGVVQPEWIFHGTVAAPLPETKLARTSAAPPPANITAKQQSKKPAAKKGFWTRLHDLFAGSPAKSDDCVGEGCS